MKKWKFFCGGLAALAGLTPNLKAQDFNALHPVPVIPSPAAAAAGLPSAAATAGPPPGGPTLWSFLGISKPQIDVIKIKVCQTPLGRLMNNSMAPMGALSGGMLGGCCPAINPADLLKPPDSAEGLAARIKAEEADAKARRAAVRYLGTVDCRWFPEAEEVLINALRKDRNECVRMEAALALSRGCCCTKKVVAALTETVEGGKKIGPVPENSERVKSMASGALSHCIACLEAIPVEEVPIKGRDIPLRPKDVPLPPPDKLPNTLGHAGSEPDVQVAAFRQIEATPISQLREQAKHALVQRREASDKVVVSAGNVKADHSLYSVLVNARKGGARPPAAHQEAMLPGSPGMILEEMHTEAPPAAQTPAAGTAMPTPAMPTPAMPSPTVPTPTMSFPAMPSAAMSSSTMPAPAMSPVAMPSPAMPSPTAESAKPLIAPPVMPAPSPEPVRIVAPAYVPEPPSTKPMSPAKELDSSSVIRIPALNQPEPPAKKIASTEAPVPAYYHNSSPYRVAATPALQQAHTESPAAKPAMSVRVISPAVLSEDDNTVKECLPTLVRWDRPDLREKAAARLGAVDCRQYPEVVEALRGRAVNDAFAGVRIACIRSLAKVGSGNAEVVATLEKLTLDRDLEVREAAKDAYDLLK